VAFAGGLPFDQIPARLRDADGFVSASRTGSLDKAALEAAAVGVPVITCNNAVHDVLGEHGDMLTFPVGDTGELAERIKTLVHTSADQRRTMANALRCEVRDKHELVGLVSRVTATLNPQSNA